MLLKVSTCWSHHIVLFLTGRIAFKLRRYKWHISIDSIKYVSLDTTNCCFSTIDISCNWFSSSNYDIFFCRDSSNVTTDISIFVLQRKHRVVMISTLLPMMAPDVFFVKFMFSLSKQIPIDDFTTECKRWHWIEIRREYHSYIWLTFIDQRVPSASKLLDTLMHWPEFRNTLMQNLKESFSIVSPLV